MSLDIEALLARARMGTAIPGADAGQAAAVDRARLERLASEFESMLLGQMLREMRRAGHWDEDDEAEKSAGFQATPLFEMLDAELAAQMARVNGLGLAQQLLDAFDRGQGEAGAPFENPITAAASMTPSTGAGLEGLSPEVRPGAELHVTSGFGWRRDPFTGETRFHRGVDLRAAYGQEVVAAAPGKVVFTGTQGGYGTTVTVQHADGTQTRYAHLSAAMVREGDAVAAGQPLGRAGSSGRAT